MSLFFAAFAAACLAPSDAGGTAESERPRITGVQLSGDGALLIQGSSLKDIRSARISGRSGVTQLNIVVISDSQVKGAARSALSLLAGTTYDLLISSAHADDITVPITVQVPPSMIPAGSPGPTGPPGLQGPTGTPGPSGTATQLWLVNGDGSTVGPVVSLTADGYYSGQGDAFVVWDEADEGFVRYRSSGVDYSGASSPSNGALIYGTADCSDAPHVDPGIPQGRILRIVNDLYKVQATMDSFVPVAYRADNIQSPRAYTSCTAITSSNYSAYAGRSAAFSQATRLSSPGIPLNLTLPIRIERR